MDNGIMSRRGRQIKLSYTPIHVLRESQEEIGRRKPEADTRNALETREPKLRRLQHKRFQQLTQDLDGHQPI